MTDRKESPRPDSNQEVTPNQIEHIDLALSGGGFRATLFHLGVIGFLRSHNLLDRVRNICSVSGGSILAAHMVTRWDEYAHKEEETFIRAAEHLIRAIQKDDLSGRVLGRARSQRRALLLKALDSKLLVEEYRRLLGPTENVVGAKVDDVTWELIPGGEQLPGRKLPYLHLLATHLNSARMCVFSNKEPAFEILEPTFVPKPRQPEPNDDGSPAGDFFGLQELQDKVEGQDVAWALAASSAFPPIFAPLPTNQKDDSDRSHLLTDGGVYDNSGVKYLRRLYEKDDELAREGNQLVILSDAGRAFSFKPGEKVDTILGLAARVSDAQGNRIAEFDSEQATHFFKSHRIPVLRCSIHRRIKRGLKPDNHSTNIQYRLREIRTELDKFSDEEVFLLYRHGYLVAKQQYLSWCQRTKFDWTPKPDADVWWPHHSLDRVSSKQLEKKLKNSHLVKKVRWLRRRIFGLVAAAFLIVALTGFMAGQVSPSLIPGTGEPTVNCGVDVIRFELVLREADSVRLGNDDHWPYAYGSGMVYDKKVDGKHQFYMITDRGPAFDGPTTNDGKNLKLYLKADYQPTIARVVWSGDAGHRPEVKESFPLTKFERQNVNGLPPAAGPEMSAIFVQNGAASQQLFKRQESVGFGIDTEDLALDPQFDVNRIFWISEEYRPALMKAELTEQLDSVVIKSVLDPTNGLPSEFKRIQPNRGIEGISIKNGWLFMAMQSALVSDENNGSTEKFIWIVRAKLADIEQFIKSRTQIPWDKYQYKIPEYYYEPGDREQCSIGGIQAIDDNRLLVLEREVGPELGRRRRITMVDLNQATGSEKTINPQSVIDLQKYGWRFEKPEGIARIDDNTIAISSDNDFGMRLQGEVELGAADAKPFLEKLDLFETILQNDQYLVKWRIKELSKFPFLLTPLKGDPPTYFWVFRLTGPATCRFENSGSQ